MKKQNNRNRKTIIVYFILSLVAIGINLVYGLFGHGVHSAAMTWMFLYPWLGGALFYFLLDRLNSGMPRFVLYRFGYNSYNSGIATLTVGSFLQGILEIAGTNSPYLVLFTIVGWLFIGVGLTVFGLMTVSRKRTPATKKKAPDNSAVAQCKRI